MALRAIAGFPTGVFSRRRLSSGATELIGVDTKEAVVSSEAEESREEDVELPSSAAESRGKVVYWPKRALKPDREVEQGVRAVRDLLFALEGVVSSESDTAGLIFLSVSLTLKVEHAVQGLLRFASCTICGDLVQ